MIVVVGIKENVAKKKKTMLLKKKKRLDFYNHCINLYNYTTSFI